MSSEEHLRDKFLRSFVLSLDHAGQQMLGPLGFNEHAGVIDRFAWAIQHAGPRVVVADLFVAGQGAPKSFCEWGHTAGPFASLRHDKSKSGWFRVDQG